ncbi:S8 family peptidase [Lysobacter capsici]|uniref:S8 family peptidase n=1 Tax=Lysobacter capsici TaxID=435897 RepID=UPI000BBA97AF|nr:S8 family serine peptidase [Lysobacter capsici]ATE73081.1 protease [Lysobacter capsici]
MFARSNSFNLLAAATALAIAAASGSAFAAGRVDLSSLNVEGSNQFGRFVVKYRSGSAPRGDVASFNKAIAGAASATSSRLGGGKRAVQLKRLRRTASGADVVLSNRALSRDEAAALMRQLAADPAVESVSNDIFMVPYFTPNDTNFSQQFGFGTGNGGIRATTAWDVTKGEGTVVAVIDTGVVSHTDLNGNIIAGYDFISGDPPDEGLPAGGFFVANDGDGRDANPADPGNGFDAGQCGPGTAARNSNWHGTHVAGTVAAVTNNAKGVAGTAHAAKIVPVRVLGRCGGYGSDISDAIIWAAGGSVPGVPANPNPADVINMSLGGSAPSACPQIYRDAVVDAAARGTIVVVAAGNSNADSLTAVDREGQPVGYTLTNCGTVISVGSVTSSGARSSFSNYGAGIDIAAPGSGILSTTNNGTRGPTTETYLSYDGTSMAAPHVAGVAALVQSVAPTPLTQEQMRTLLKNTARAFPVSPGTKPIGAGIVNAAAAVAAVQGTNPGAQTYSNGTDANIPDNNATGVSTSITVSGRTGNAPSNAHVAVSIVHTYQGDLIVDLIAPDGSVYNLHSRTGAGTDNINQTYTVNLSSEALNGTWKLRAADRDAQDTGRIDSWSVTF